MDWTCKPFAALSAADCHAAFALRQAVFVIEQACIFPDLDGLDPGCHHLLGWDGDELAAYARLLPPGLKYPEASIGRITTAHGYRRTGLGKALVAQGLAELGRLWPGANVLIGAQAHLEDFYQAFGFVTCSDVYDEDGIDHVDMRLIAPAASKTG